MFKNRITRHTSEDPSQLLANPKNARKHPGSQRDAIRSALSEVGFVTSVIVNETTGMLLDGHMRVEEAISAGIETIPVTYVNLSKEEEDYVLLTYDPIGAMAKYDSERVEDLLNNVDLDSELDGVLKELGVKNSKETINENKMSDETKTIDYKKGDIVEIKQENNITHRIMCGDSTKRDHIDILVGDKVKKIDLCFTDPPYGVDYEKKATSILGRTEYAKVTNDEKGFDLGELIKKSFDNIYYVLGDEGSYYITAPMGGVIGLMMQQQMKDSNIECKHCLIWVKDSPVFSMGRLDYDYQHEPIFFGWKNKHNRYAAGKYNTSVWQIPRPKKSPLHPTMKPVELVENCILNSSKKNDNVIDLFGGSGTTLIAAAKHERNSFIMETDPIYHTIIINRYKEWAETNNIEYSINIVNLNKT